MSKDLVGALKQKWWNNAKDASKWKPKYECINEIFNILTGNEEVNVEIQCGISDHEKADDLMRILTEWLVNENHIFVRIGILRIMPKLIEGFSKKIIMKYQTELIETIMTKQWRERKRSILVLTTPILIALLLKTGFILNDDKYRGHLISALKHRAKESRYSAADFIAKATMYRSNKRQIATLCENAQLGTLISKLAQCDKDREVRLAACRVFYGLEAAGILKERWINRALPARLEVLEKDKFGRRNLQIAAKEYNKQKTMISGTITDENDDDEEDEKKSSVFMVEERRWRTGDGKLSCGIIKHKHNCVKPKVIEEDKPIDPNSLEDNRVALKYVDDKHMHDLLIHGYLRRNNVKRIPNDLCNLWITYIGFQFNEPNTDTTFRKLQTWCKKDEGSLKKTAKTTDRIRTLHYIKDDLMLLSPSQCSYLYDAIVGLAKECMGWEGRDARNPRLAKTFLRLISHVMAKGDINRLNAGIFNVYLSWVLQRLAETKFNKLASECLLNTCYQFSTKVVFSQIELLLLHPVHPNKDPFKNDKAWGPVIKFIGDAVKEFGVDNFYVKRLIHIIHSKIAIVKSESAKQACYSSLTILYQQLGSDWGEVLLSGVHKQGKKALTKKWQKIPNVGTYTQLRCIKAESIPVTDPSSDHRYRDIVSEEKVEEVPLSIKISVEQTREGKRVRNNPSNVVEPKQDGIVGVSRALPMVIKTYSNSHVSSNVIKIKAEAIEILSVFKDNIKKDVYISLQKAFANDIIIATYATMDLAAW
eukprot:CAMPEP_0201564432 /NCGR_PEP_ID=MMETSP0190_2-20130828/2720_1 /ASSEMBLY_ACC=CAM_ASM_000263 /TAXON_ID=37353 /ORGANISM="Rosalina sp." /LENGTH=760 /DNA_ID=CAMNT_0047980613 /DNA_START=97 /DNA_END=2376 /DNA_ORIENTATION=+